MMNVDPDLIKPVVANLPIALIGCPQRTATMSYFPDKATNNCPRRAASPLKIAGTDNNELRT
jgi:hypothetical protein